MRCCVVICCLLLIAACGEGSVQVPAGKPAKKNDAPANDVKPEAPQLTEEEMLAQLRADIRAVAARQERAVEEIEVQHILIGVTNPRVAGVTRTPKEAELKAARVYARIKAGEDVASLVAEYTDDSPPGIYPMTQSSRSGMVNAFGNVGWRLEVGEVGVAPFHTVDSPFGYHIIKRLK